MTYITPMIHQGVVGAGDNIASSLTHACEKKVWRSESSGSLDIFRTAKGGPPAAAPAPIGLSDKPRFPLGPDSEQI